MADFRLTRHGTLDMIGLSREAHEDMVEITADDALWLGRSLAAEPRFTANIVAALAAEGFEVETAICAREASVCPKGRAVGHFGKSVPRAIGRQVALRS